MKLRLKNYGTFGDAEMIIAVVREGICARLHSRRIALWNLPSQPLRCCCPFAEARCDAWTLVSKFEVEDYGSKESIGDCETVPYSHNGLGRFYKQAEKEEVQSTCIKLGPKCSGIKTHRCYPNYSDFMQLCVKPKKFRNQMYTPVCIHRPPKSCSCT